VSKQESLKDRIISLSGVCWVTELTGKHLELLKHKKACCFGCNRTLFTQIRGTNSIFRLCELSSLTLVSDQILTPWPAFEARICGNNQPNCFKPVLTSHFWCFLDKTGFGSKKKCFVKYPIDFPDCSPNCTKITTMSSKWDSKVVKNTFPDFGLCFNKSLLCSAFQRTQPRPKRCNIEGGVPFPRLLTVWTLNIAARARFLVWDAAMWNTLPVWRVID
jgi:hypothetical protein